MIIKQLQSKSKKVNMLIYNKLVSFAPTVETRFLRRYFFDLFFAKYFSFLHVKKNNNQLRHV